MIEIRGLVKAFGLQAALRGVNLDLAEGEFVALLGPNGAGKTTLLRVLATLSKPTSGIVRVGGYDVKNSGSAIRRLIGLVSHHTLLYPHLSAEDNLRFFGQMYQIEDVGTRVDEVLDIVDLTNRRGDLVRTFSRGMQQRLAIARAVLHQPPLLLLDEPHTGLDQDAGEILDHLLVDIAAQGKTVVMTSHDLVRASGLASRLDILSKGRISHSVSKEDFTSTDLIQLYKAALGGEGGQS